MQADKSILYKETCQSIEFQKWSVGKFNNCSDYTQKTPRVSFYNLHFTGKFIWALMAGVIRYFTFEVEVSKLIN